MKSDKMDLGDIIGGIVAIVLVGAALIFAVALAVIAFVIALYAAAYTIAFFHIILIEPVIFDTYSLFTIPYNEIWAMANMHAFLYWLLVFMYAIGIGEGILGNKS